MGFDEPNRRSVHEGVEVEEFVRIWVDVRHREFERPLDGGNRTREMPMKLRKDGRESARERVRAVRAAMSSKSGFVHNHSKVDVI